LHIGFSSINCCLQVEKKWGRGEGWRNSFKTSNGMVQLTLAVIIYEGSYVGSGPSPSLSFTHMHIHAHARTHTHAYIRIRTFLTMIISRHGHTVGAQNKACLKDQHHQQFFCTTQCRIFWKWTFETSLTTIILNLPG